MSSWTSLDSVYSGSTPPKLLNSCLSATVNTLLIFEIIKTQLQIFLDPLSLTVALTSYFPGSVCVLEWYVTVAPSGRLSNVTVCSEPSYVNSYVSWAN